MTRFKAFTHGRLSRMVVDLVEEGEGLEEGAAMVAKSAQEDLGAVNSRQIGQ